MYDSDIFINKQDPELLSRIKNELRHNYIAVIEGSAPIELIRGRPVAMETKKFQTDDMDILIPEILDQWIGGRKRYREVDFVLQRAYKVGHYWEPDNGDKKDLRLGTSVVICGAVAPI